MITIIFGKPGSGKTSLLTHFLIDTYLTQRQELLKFTRKQIGEANKTRQKRLTVPDKPPIFSNYAVRTLVGYRKYYEPYYLNGYYFGLPNDKMPVQYVMPGAKLFLTEAQRYYDSRKSQSTPDWVFRAYEAHRQYYLDIYMDVQRPINIDKNIRDIADRFIEVQGMRQVRDQNGWMVRSVFDCRTFSNFIDVENYLENGEKRGEAVQFVHEGDIFDSFNSYGCFEDFLPAEGKDFDCLPFLTMSEVGRLKEDESAFYTISAPKEYRRRA